MTELFEEIIREIYDDGKEETANHLIRRVKERDGDVPLIFTKMAERPEVLISHLLYKTSIAETSALDPKCVELISLAVGAALNCRPCTEYHMRSALKKGVSKDEILEAVLLAGMLAQSSVLADAYRVLDSEDICSDGSCSVGGISSK